MTLLVGTCRREELNLGGGYPLKLGFMSEICRYCQALFGLITRIIRSFQLGGKGAQTNPERVSFAQFEMILY